MKEVKIYYCAYTAKGNLGDLLITKYLIEELARYGDVYVDCHGMPEDFCRVIFDTDSTSVKDFERYYGISFRSANILKVIRTLNRQGFTHFCDNPGPRIPFHMPLHRLLTKMTGKSIPFLFLNKRIKRYSLGIDLNYSQKGILARLNKWHFGKIDVLGVRSVANTDRLRKSLSNVIYVPDMAFLYPKFQPNLFDTRRNKIALSFRRVEEYKQLVHDVRGICNVSDRLGIEVDILFQVDEDGPFCRQLYQEANGRNVHFVEKAVDYYSVEIYQRYDIVFSNRLHVLLMAAMNGAIPCGLISHDRKESKIKDIFNSVFNSQLLYYIEDFDENVFLSMYENQDAVKKEVRTSVSGQKELCQTTLRNLLAPEE